MDGYNEQHDVWGYKRPNIIFDIHKLEGLVELDQATKESSQAVHLKFREFHQNLRNPIYILTFKDVFSISNRNRISMNTDLVKQMIWALDYYRLIINIFKNNSINALFLSVPKIIIDKESLIYHLVELCGLTPSFSQMKAALSFITPDPKDYLLNTNQIKL